MELNRQIDDYFDLVINTLEQLDRKSIAEFVNIVIEICNNDGTIFIFGNGGSGATASHICGDLVKGIGCALGRKIRAICLNDNTPSLMAIANDISYDDIFVEQLKNFLKKDDLVIGISGSGNSDNVIKALQYANRVGAKTIGFCGFSGGRVKEIVSLAIHADIDNMEVVEDIHMIVGHCMKNIIINEFQSHAAHEFASSVPGY